jgi:tRNA 2-selenouridine synthase
LESESLSIGKVYLPETLWESINQAPVVELSIPKKERIKRLVQEYGRFDKDLLISSTKKISKKFGHHNVKQVELFILEDKLEKAAGLLLDYYDKSYNFSQNRYKTTKPLIVKSGNGDPQVNAEKVLTKAEEIIFDYDHTAY